jgi:hypothetical protein
MPLEVIGVAGRPAYDDRGTKAGSLRAALERSRHVPPSERDRWSTDIYIGARPIIAVRAAGNARDLVPQIRARDS